MHKNQKDPASPHLGTPICAPLGKVNLWNFPITETKPIIFHIFFSLWSLNLDCMAERNCVAATTNATRVRLNFNNEAGRSRICDYQKLFKMSACMTANILQFVSFKWAGVPIPTPNNLPMLACCWRPFVCIEPMHDRAWKQGQDVRLVCLWKSGVASTRIV